MTIALLQRTAEMQVALNQAVRDAYEKIQGIESNAAIKGPRSDELDQVKATYDKLISDMLLMRANATATVNALKLPSVNYDGSAPITVNYRNVVSTPLTNTVNLLDAKEGNVVSFISVGSVAGMDLTVEAGDYLTVNITDEVFSFLFFFHEGKWHYTPRSRDTLYRRGIVRNGRGAYRVNDGVIEQFVRGKPGQHMEWPMDWPPGYQITSTIVSSVNSDYVKDGLIYIPNDDVAYAPTLRAISSILLNNPTRVLDGFYYNTGTFGLYTQTEPHEEGTLDLIRDMSLVAYTTDGTIVAKEDPSHSGGTGTGDWDTTGLVYGHTQLDEFDMVLTGDLTQVSGTFQFRPIDGSINAGSENSYNFVDEAAVYPVTFETAFLRDRAKRVGVIDGTNIMFSMASSGIFDEYSVGAVAEGTSKVYLLKYDRDSASVNASDYAEIPFYFDQDEIAFIERNGNHYLVGADEFQQQMHITSIVDGEVTTTSGLLPITSPNFDKNLDMGFIEVSGEIFLITTDKYAGQIYSDLTVYQCVFDENNVMTLVSASTDIVKRRTAECFFDTFKIGDMSYLVTTDTVDNSVAISQLTWEDDILSTILVDDIYFTGPGKVKYIDGASDLLMVASFYKAEAVSAGVDPDLIDSTDVTIYELGLTDKEVDVMVTGIHESLLTVDE